MTDEAKDEARINLARCMTTSGREWGIVSDAA
jgi:hypothetical protein